MKTIDQFRYIKIQSNTIDLRTRLWGITRVCGVYSQEPRTEVYCIRLTFKIQVLVICPRSSRPVETIEKSWIFLSLLSSPARVIDRSPLTESLEQIFFATTTEIITRSLANFHCQYANRYINKLCNVSTNERAVDSLLIWQCYDEIHHQEQDRRMKNGRQFIKLYQFTIAQINIPPLS